MSVRDLVLSRSCANRRMCHRHVRIPSTSSFIVVIVVVLVVMATSKTLVPDSHSSTKTQRVIDGDDDGPWLADGTFYDVDPIGDLLQADGHPIVVDLCPRVPKVLPVGGCALQECSSDRECVSLGLMCCYNGCIYTCLPQVRPPAYFDWLKEPRRRKEFGNSWLIEGQDQEQDFIPCSTTTPDDDSDPLLCPHGQECVVDNQGDPSEGIPNSGHCAQSHHDPQQDKEITFEDQMTEVKAEQIDPPTMESRRHCKIDDNLLLLSGHSAVINGKKCVCSEKELKCEN